MSSKSRQGRAQVARDAVRDQMREAYEKLAKFEAQRTDWLAAALDAAAACRAALEAATAAKQRLAQAAADLIGSGLKPAEVADLVGLDARELRRLR